MSRCPFKVGAAYPTWFSGNADGLSRIVAVKPYTGIYPQWFTHVLELTAPNTNKGTVEMTADARSEA